MAGTSSAQESAMPDEESQDGVNDLASLAHLDETAMLDNLRVRYMRDVIYVSTTSLGACVRHAFLSCRPLSFMEIETIFTRFVVLICLSASCMPLDR